MALGFKVLGAKPADGAWGVGLQVLGAKPAGAGWLWGSRFKMKSLQMVGGVYG